MEIAWQPHGTSMVISMSATWQHIATHMVRAWQTHGKHGQPHNNNHDLLDCHVCLSCVCHAIAMRLPCVCHARVMLLSWYCHVCAMLLTCSCQVCAMLLPCSCHAIVMIVPCACHDSAMIVAMHLVLTYMINTIDAMCVVMCCYVFGYVLPCPCHVGAICCVPCGCHARVMRLP
jgi:hypothetical protein